ncbi:MAG: hypothetical protein WBC24_09140 [Methylovirgula sp.]
MAVNPRKTAADRDAAKSKAASAEQRLAVALRENLRRRKMQERGRRAAEDQGKLPD